MLHRYPITVTFGDCDPAGIVYYPNILRWVDGAFHDWLRQYGGHGDLCARLGAIGAGLMDVRCTFRSPLRDGDRLVITLQRIDWARRSLSAHCAGHVGDRLAFEAVEVRGLFMRTQGAITAAPVEGLRALVGQADG